MMTPSSISQSDFFESFGKMILSFAPHRQVTAFMNTIGSRGIRIFASAACSI